MKCEIYVNDIKLDLLSDESIKMKFIKKDAQDLSKVFAPFSYGFSIPATPRNKRALNFFGDTKLIRAYQNYNFPCRIYLGGILNKEGELKIENIKYDRGNATSYNVSFNSKILSLKDQIGDDTFAEVGSFPVSWRPNSVYNSIQTEQDVEGLKWYTPLSSRYRVWQVDRNAVVTDNIAYSPLVSPLTQYLVKVDELRPAVSVASLFRLIKEKYNFNFNMPVENKDEFNKAFIWCNGDNFNNGTRKLVLKKQYSGNVDATIDLSDSSTLVNIPSGEARFVSLILFKNVYLLDRKESAKGTISLVDKNTNEVIAVKQFTFENGDNLVDVRYNRVFPYPAETIEYYTYIQSDTPFSWQQTNATATTVDPTGGLTTSSYFNNDSSSETRINYVDLLKAIPNVKVIDFLNSLFKTFNINIFESSNNDGGLDFLTEEDINSENQTYSKKVVDYTPYVSKNEWDKKVFDEFNYYKLSHKKSKYKSNVDFFNQFGVEYGQATFPTVKPPKAKEYKIETSFAVIPPVTINGADDIVTFYGFDSSTPEFEEGQGFRYKPNTADLTIFYKKPSTHINNIGCQNLNGSGVLVNSPLSYYQPTSPFLGDEQDVNLSFAPLVFKSIGYNNTLYIQHYEALIQQFLNPNTLEHSFDFQFPISELVLTKGNKIQPNGFRLQNELIIKEELYEVSEMDLDLTTGKAKAKLINKL